MNSKRTLKYILSDFQNKTGKTINFRSHKYLNHGSLDYDTAYSIVIFAYNYLDNFLTINKKRFPDFDGWVWNKEIELDKLKTIKLKVYLLCLIEELISHEVKR